MKHILWLLLLAIYQLPAVHMKVNPAAVQKVINAALNHEMWQATNDQERLRKMFENTTIPDINALDDSGYTMLMQAALEGYVDITTLLIVFGAHLNLQNRHGRTALMCIAGRYEPNALPGSLSYSSNATARAI